MVWAQARAPSCSVQGFRKSDPDLWQFSNDHFIRGRKDLLTEIQRKKTAAAGKEATAPGAAAIEVGLFQLSQAWQTAHGLHQGQVI
jgi:hypothetical protein